MLFILKKLHIFKDAKSMKFKCYISSNNQMYRSEGIGKYLESIIERPNYSQKEIDLISSEHRGLLKKLD